MSIPEAGESLISTKLDMALKTDDTRAVEVFREVYAMLDYAMAVGHLSPGQYSDQRRRVEMFQQRRQYL